MVCRGYAESFKATFTNGGRIRGVRQGSPVAYLIDGQSNRHLEQLVRYAKKTMTHKKIHLPTKKCVQCGRDFAWRKKWERTWEQVRMCSERCRRMAATSAKSKTDSSQKS
jgi:hypothetical protein